MVVELSFDVYRWLSCRYATSINLISRLQGVDVKFGKKQNSKFSTSYVADFADRSNLIMMLCDVRSCHFIKQQSETRNAHIFSKTKISQIFIMTLN